MPTATAATVEINSKRDLNGKVLLHTCQLITEAGPVKFVDGRATVPVSVANVLYRRDDIQAPGESPILDTGVPFLDEHGELRRPGEAERAMADLLQNPVVAAMQAQVDALTGIVRELAAERLGNPEPPPDDEAEAEADDVAAAIAAAVPEDQQTDPAPPARPPGARPLPPRRELSEAEKAARAAAAAAELQAAGLSATPVVVPDGFEPTLPNGAPRCQARKTDDAQCANAAHGGRPTCALEGHMEQYPE